MREIKFRAWDKRLKEWLGAHHWVIDPNNGAVMVYLEDEELYRVINHVALMQYTGLKDKNGVEIYEGDLFEDGEDESVNWVVYDADYAGYGTEGNHGNNWWTPADLAKHASEYEVIGNIYENKDLL
jgi:uncharacterized phage protein (TIGR01671 family)